MRQAVGRCQLDMCSPRVPSDISRVLFRDIPNLRIPLVDGRHVCACAPMWKNHMIMMQDLFTRGLAG